MIQIESIDHLVLTVNELERTVKFYTEVLGMTCVEFKEGRFALFFGEQKINLHLANCPFKPHALNTNPGNADICFITVNPISDVVKVLNTHGITIIEGPVLRTGATSKIESVYFYDPDGNLIELANKLH